ncbi:MAG: cobalamin-dependent protein [Candidatus Latescibacteria bacterium]|nr:cobalamin-dependent protein [Candidatus Latescibacterota bacterium]
MIAANCGYETTVMEWPSLDEIRDELLNNNYKYIGISFIPSTFNKMKKIVETVREVSPSSKIIIGGYGTAVPHIENLVDVDYICKGEGIRFIRNILKKSPTFHLNHPLVTSSIVEFLGIQIPFVRVGQIVTGLGCQYGCEFCVTSAFFNCVYQPFLTRGEDIYTLIEEQCRSSGLKNYWIIDENFLFNRERIYEFHNTICRRGNKIPDYSIDMIWSTSDLVSSYTPLQLAEIGVTKCWMGYESMFTYYKKNKNTNFSKLIKELNEVGISVLLSCTAFVDSHDENSWKEELNQFISLGQAYSQFLPLCAFPGTPLYKKMDRAGRIIDGMAWEDKHALSHSFHKHDKIPIWRQKSLIHDAYCKEYERNGPSQIRDLLTRLKGYENMIQSGSEILAKKAEYLKKHLINQVPWVLAARKHIKINHQLLVDKAIAELERIIDKNCIKNSEIASKYIDRLICKNLKVKNGKEVTEREPGTRISIYDGYHSKPILVKNPVVW